MSLFNKNKDKDKDKKIKPIISEDVRTLMFIFFIAFYFILFSFISIQNRNRGVNKNNESNKVNENKKVEGINYEFSLDDVLNNNYNFKYDIYLNNVLYSYDGKRYEYKEKFNYILGDNKVVYYKDKYYYYMFDINSNNYINSINPYIVNEFIDIENIINIIRDSTYVSKTDYDSGKIAYNFSIKNSNLYNVIYDIEIDDKKIGEKVNDIYIGTDEDKNVNNIKLILNSYCLYNNKCESLVVDLNYDNFYNIEDFDR